MLENAQYIQRWYKVIGERANNSQLLVLAGMGLVMISAAVAVLNPFIVVCSALLLVVLVVILPRPILIIYSLAFLTPLFGGFARGAIIPLLRLGQALLVIGFIFFLLAVPSRQGKFRLTVIDLVFALFFLCEAVFPVLALLYRGEHLNLTSTGYYNEGSALQTLLGPIQYYLLYRIVVAIISSEKQIIVVLKLSFLASIIVSIIGILQQLGIGPVTTFLRTYYPSVDLSTSPLVSRFDPRITSTLESHSGLAAYLAFTLILGLACYTTQKQQFIPLPLLVATFLFDSIALLLAGTVAAWIGLIVGAYIVFRQVARLPRSLLLVLIGVVPVVFLFLLVISGRFTDWFGGSGQALFPTYAERIRLWKEIFLPAIGLHVWFGSGPAPAALDLWLSEETEYLHLLLRGGVLYLLSYILLMGVAMTICWRQMKIQREGPKHVVAIATFAILVTLNVMNVSSVYFSQAGGAQTIWLLLAIVVAIQQLQTLSAPAPIDKKVIFSEQPIAVEEPIDDAHLLNGVGGIERIVRTSRADVPENGAQKPHQQRFEQLRRRLDWHFVKDSVVVGMGSTMARVLGLLFATLLARFLTNDDYGFYRYATTLVGIIAIASTASPTSIGRFLAANANDRQARDRYFSNGVFGVAILLGVLLLLSVPILARLQALNVGTITYMIGATGYYCYLAIARGMNSAWKMSLTFTLSNAALMVAFFVIFGLFHIRTSTLALTIYGLTDLAPILLLELSRPMLLRFRFKLISRSTLLELARFATPIVIATGAYTIWSGTDVLLVQYFTPHAAGSYAAAKTLSGGFLFVPAAITLVLMPKVAGLERDGGKRYSVAAVLASLLISLVGLMAVIIWGYQILILAFGARYSDAYLPLVVLSVGMCFFSIYAIVEGFVIGRGRPHLSVQALVVALVSTAISGFWLTSRMGIVGASLSFTLGAGLGTITLLFTTWRYLSKDHQVLVSS